MSLDRADIERRLLESALFSALEPPDLCRLVAAAKPVAFRLGQTLAKVGDPPDAFFVLLSGRARVLSTRDGREVVLATLQAGEALGLEAVVNHQPHPYITRAADDLTALRVPANAFDALVGAHPELAGYFQRYLDEISIRAFLKLFTLFAPLPARHIASLVDHLEERHHRQGEFVFHQGDEGDAFYIVRNGHVEMVDEKEGRARIVGEARTGEFFGELALLYGNPRLAGVRCVVDTDLFRLDRSVFEKLHDQQPEVRKKILEAVTHYRIDPSTRERLGLPSLSMAPPAAAPTGPASLPAGANDEEEAPAMAPPWRLWGRYPWLRQHDEMDCGAASLAMVLRYWGRNVSISRLRDLANVGRDGASMLSLAEAAEGLGFNARGLRADLDTLTQMRLPAIAHWGGNHFVVVYRATARRVLVADPGVGIRWLSAADFRAGWTGFVLALTPTPRLSGKEDKKASLGRFLPFLMSYRTTLLEVLLASLVISLLGLAAPMFTQTIVDRVLVHHAFSVLQVVAVGMVLVALFTTAVTAARQILLMHVSTRVDLQMLSVFYRHLLDLPVDYFEKRQIGDFVSRFTEAAKIREMLTGTAVSTILDTMLVVVYLGLMLHYNVGLTLAVLLLVPLFAIATYAFTPFLQRISREIRARHAASESVLIESISGIHTVKTLAAERGVRWKWEDLYLRYAQASLRGQLAVTAIDAVSGLLNRGSSLFLLYAGAVLVIRGELTVGEFIAFTAVAAAFLAPVCRFITLWHDLQETLVAAERLGEVLDAEVEQPQGRDALLRPRHFEGHVKLENVSFRYGARGEKNVLANITLEIPAGETLAIVGRSGSGKTTLAKLVMGMYRPTEGRIIVDGHDLAALDLHAYRRRLGVVMQDSFLFSGTIRENIALGDPHPDLERIVHAATLAHAHDFIAAMPQGYETLVGERGARLSGGQRQRIAIARALYGNPGIIVLDEATSSLDTESERMIQQNLGRWLAGRTAIVIAHRVSTVQDAHHIVVVDDGVIVESGTHRTLMEQKGLYYYLNSQQLAL